MSYSNSQDLFTAQTASGTSGIFEATGCIETIITLTVSNDTLSAATVIIEASDDRLYAGTWAQLLLIDETGSTPTPTPNVALAQNTKVVIQVRGAYEFIRVRLNENVTGGADISAVAWGVR